MTRSDMLGVADQLERAGQAKRALSAKRKWVKASEARLSKRGPAGLAQSANEYETLLNDRFNAVRLLKQAWTLSPEKKEIAEKLALYDVYRQDELWVSKSQLHEAPKDAMEDALREGRVIEGMTPDQVGKSLGKPDRISRFASASKTQILWVFEATRLSVLFERSSKRKDAEAKVKSVFEVPTR